MNKFCFNILVSCLILIVSDVMAGETSKNLLPSYQEEVSVFLANHKGKSIDEKDKAIMSKAAFDLDRTMPDSGLKPGEKAPDFTLTNAFGEEIKLSEQLKKGPVVFLHFTVAPGVHFVI